MKLFLMILTLLITGLSLPNGSSIASGFESPIWAPPGLSELIEEGLSQNRELQSIELKAAGLRAEVSVAGALNDPVVGIGLLNVPTDSFSFSQEPMTQKQLFIAQKIPWFGKLDLKSQEAALMADRQEALLTARRLSLARQIADTYYQLGIIEINLDINHRLMEMVKQLIQVSETRYSSGKGLQQDVLQAQVELSNLLDEKLTLDKNRRTIEDRMNELLNRETFSPVAPPEKPDEPELTLNVISLQKMALKQNPWLKAKQAEVDQALVAVKLAEKDYWPDMDFKIAYGQRSENAAGQDLPDFLSASAAMNIPLWQKTRQNKKLSASRSRREAASKEYRNLAIRLPHQVDALAGEIESLTKNYYFFKDALTMQAEQWARSSMSAYEVGKVEFNTMITARIRLLRIELKTATYLYRIYQKRAELEEIIGRPLPEAAQSS
ncbi:MAG: TolC family protein [Desulfobacterales bacterium]